VRRRACAQRGQTAITSCDVLGMAIGRLERLCDALDRSSRAAMK
jgi:hypothetical protein